MTIRFLLLKMKCLNPQRKGLYCISLIKPLFYYGICFYEGRQDVHADLKCGCMRKTRKRKTDHLQPQSATIYMTCMSDLYPEICWKISKDTQLVHTVDPCLCFQGSGLLCISWAGSSHLLQAHILKAWLACYLRSFHSAYWIQLS